MIQIKQIYYRKNYQKIHVERPPPNQDEEKGPFFKVTSSLWNIVASVFYINIFYASIFSRTNFFVNLKTNNMKTFLFISVFAWIEWNVVYGIQSTILADLKRMEQSSVSHIPSKGEKIMFFV